MEDGEGHTYWGHRFTMQCRTRYASSERVEEMTKAIKKQEKRNGRAELMVMNTYPVATNPQSGE